MWTVASPVGPTRRALIIVTAIMTADTTVFTGQASGAIAVVPPARLDTHRARRLVFTPNVAATGTGVLAARTAGIETVEELLRRRAALPAGHPDQAVLRTRSIEAGLPLARALAARYQGRGEPFDDLCQVAYLGLMRAVDGYDPARQLAFATYAVPTIVGSLKRHFRDTTWQVRVPRRIQELAISFSAARGHLAQQLGRAPTLTELAADLGAADDDVALAMNSWHFRHPESLDSLSATDVDDRRPFSDTVGVIDVAFDEVTDWQTLQPLLAALPARERRILGMRFFGDLTQSEIAVQVGLSQMHVSRLLARVLAQLRAGMLDDERAPHLAPNVSRRRGSAPTIHIGPMPTWGATI
jgi:RNA polymerase sigma-B factor